MSGDHGSVPPQVLFDLDGTLTDSAPGITRCLEHAVHAVGGEPPPPARLSAFIGTPLADIFLELLPGADGTTVARAVAAYRDRFDRVGIRENTVYPGIEAVLHALREDGCELYIATAKREEDARRVLAGFGLEKLFRGVFGSSPEQGISTKTEVLARGLGSGRIPVHAATLVGDRHHDVDAALALGARPVGVAWGYGSLDELRRAAAIAHAPGDLPALLLGASP